MEQSNFAKKAVAALKEYCDREYGGSVNAMIESLGIEVGNGVVHKWFRGGATPQLKVIGPFMDKIGADIITPGSKNFPININYCNDTGKTFEQLQKENEELRHQNLKLTVENAFIKKLSALVRQGENQVKGK